MPKPKVSIPICTYNHSQFIERCLKGIAAQRGDFDIEILIGDDCSLDNTRQVIQQFASSNPELNVKLFFREKNLGPSLNSILLFRECQGEYIALCDGDDFWDDETKLQKQLDFLEANKEYSLAYHRISTKIMSKDVRGYCYPEIDGDVLELEDAVHQHYIPTVSLVFRASMFELPTWYDDKRMKSGDITITLLLLCKGPGHFIREAMAVKRRHKMSLTHSDLFKEHYGNHQNYTFIFENLDRDSSGKFSALFRQRIITHRKGVLLGAIRNGDLKVVFQSIGILLKYWIK
ncbi:MAG: glycosyltransferase [Roseivirga sp.]|uniref:glycosyltransferase family 2 protein n=1 Tax=Roseivirga sp. TaxID=1964215 RepID=UPI001B1EF77A|nr:glycosyltransferase [Roseivirga sp.]MBO6660495.1 glycosyltransferase [Roseivirga sp.]MBO6762611.1 glycosyltransferase [Roseivirga sp.]MBO6906768.1 glycosyltransferase [Roseivirga sp.]